MPAAYYRVVSRGAGATLFVVEGANMQPARPRRSRLGTVSMLLLWLYAVALAVYGVTRVTDGLHLPAWWYVALACEVVASGVWRQLFRWR